MKLLETDFNGLFVLEPRIFEDKRGYFFESYKKEFFTKNFGSIKFCQDNESKSSYGVLRGLHYQLSPYAQTKLVRVIKGAVLDVVVDLRRDSNTFGKYFSIELSEVNKKQLFIPRGFAHGFIVLSSEAVFSYKVDNVYNKEYERGIVFNDNKLNIDWKIPKKSIIVSQKDINLPQFDKAELF